MGCTYWLHSKREWNAAVTPGCADAYNNVQKTTLTMPGFVLESLTKAEKGQKELVWPCLGTFTGYLRILL